MFYSGITGGQVAVNYAGFTVILFPLSIGYAIVKHDLFEIDALVKRSVYYISVTATLAVAYLGFLGLTNWAVRSAEIARSPLFPLLFTFVVVLAFNPLKDLVQLTIIAGFSGSSTTRRKYLKPVARRSRLRCSCNDVVALVWKTIEEAMPVARGGIYIRSSETRRYESVFPVAHRPALDAEHPLIACLANNPGRVVSRYNLDDEFSEDKDLLSAFDVIEAELLLRLAFKGDLIGFIALGKKESGAYFSMDDFDFLRTLANQSALSIANAIAYREIQKLNAV